MGIRAWSSTAMAARLLHVDMFGHCSAVACASVPMHRLRSGLRRSTHLAVLRIEKSLGSDNLMTCFQAEPSWRGSEPDVYDRPYRLQISWIVVAISAYRLLGRSGKRWCSI